MRSKETNWLELKENKSLWKYKVLMDNLIITQQL